MPVRDAVPEDIDEITAMVRAHAEHEGGSHLCQFASDNGGEALFGDDHVLRGLIAFPEGESKTRAGFTLWYPTFSSWLAIPGIWVEDLYVRPEYRGTGLGRAMLMDLRSRTRGRVEWDVHLNNEAARGFYSSLGAAPVTEWTKFRWTL